MCPEEYNTFKLKTVSPIIEVNKQNSKVDLDVQMLSDISLNNRTYDTVLMAEPPSYRDSQIFIELDCNEDSFLQENDFSSNLNYLDLARNYEPQIKDESIHYYMRSDPNMLQYDNFEKFSFKPKLQNNSTSYTTLEYLDLASEYADQFGSIMECNHQKFTQSEPTFLNYNSTINKDFESTQSLHSQSLGNYGKLEKSNGKSINSSSSIFRDNQSDTAINYTDTLSKNQLLNHQSSNKSSCDQDKSLKYDPALFEGFELTAADITYKTNQVTEAKNKINNRRLLLSRALIKGHTAKQVQQMHRNATNKNAYKCKNAYKKRAHKCRDKNIYNKFKNNDDKNHVSGMMSSDDDEITENKENYAFFTMTNNFKGYRESYKERLKNPFHKIQIPVFSRHQLNKNLTSNNGLDDDELMRDTKISGDELMRDTKISGD